MQNILNVAVHVRNYSAGATCSLNDESRIEYSDIDFFELKST